MKPGFGPTELQRALARQDVEDLRRDLAEKYKYHQWYSGGKRPTVTESDRGMPCDSVFFDRERRLAMVALAMAEYDDVAFLTFVSAGLLEDALVHFPSESPVSDEFLGRIIDEARRTARFRWMLSGVWTTSCTAEVADAIKQAVAGANMDIDPLPPRPYP